MEIVASYSEYGKDDEIEYVLYRFILDACFAVKSLAEHDQNVEALEIARKLENRAIGLWRSEEHPSVIEARMRSLVYSAEILLRDNWFDFEWMDGYDIYYTANQED
jgi:hypothetical protein